MAGTTKQNLPFPLGPATPFVHLDLKSLAEAIDGRLVTYCTESPDTRPTGSARYLGAWICCTDTFAYGFWDGSAWRMVDTQAQLWTPVVSSTGAPISQGTFFGRYFRGGKRVQASMRWVTGSLGGALDTAFTLPPAGTPNVTNMPLLRGVANLSIPGVVGYFLGGVRLSSATQFQIYMPGNETDNKTRVLSNTDAGNGAGAGVPAVPGTYTLVSPAEVTADFDYELV